MLRHSLRLPIVLIITFLVVHVLIESRVFGRGIMVPSIAQLVEWVLTFPLALLTFFYGQPRSPLMIGVYYILVVGNAFVLSWLIRKIFGRESKRLD